MSVGNEAKHSGLRMTVIIPAFNEEAYLAATLDSIHDAAEMVRAGTDVDVETIVVDNNSRDATAAVARAKGAAVVREPVQSISRARNAGARHATGEVLIFIDADVVVPCALLQVICTAMGDPKCVGGGVDVDFYRAMKKLARSTDRTVRFITEPRVRPSCRRFDKWPVWKILLWTNPLYIALFRGWKPAWKGWYSNAVR